jgi:hypothetical protein
MRVINLAKGGRAIIDDQDFERVSAVSWFLSRNGYVVHSVYDRGKRKTIYLHRFVMNAPQNRIVDHRDGNKCDNRRGNLRLCSNTQNSQNRADVRGVSWHKPSRKWRAYISVSGKQLSLGMFEKYDDALARRVQAETKLFGEFAGVRCRPRTRPASPSRETEVLDQAA